MYSYTLTDKAQKAYNESDYRILTWYKDDRFCYNVTTSCYHQVATELTEKELNDWFEDLYDEVAEND